MPAWILTLIANIGPLTSVAEGIVKIGEAVANEIKGSDSVEEKAAVVAGDVASAAGEIGTALVSNTPHATPTPQPEAGQSAS